MAMKINVLIIFSLMLLLVTADLASSRKMLVVHQNKPKVGEAQESMEKGEVAASGAAATEQPDTYNHHTIPRQSWDDQNQP